MQRPVLSILALTDTMRGRRVLLQRRSKEQDDTPYNGLLELPQGKIADLATVTTFAKFKLHNETGLEIVRFLVGEESQSDVGNPSSKLYTSTPFCCVADAVQNHFAVAVVLLVKGETHITEDARDHRWCTVKDIEKALAGEMVFPLNVPMLARLLEHATDFALDAGT